MSSSPSLSFLSAAKTKIVLHSGLSGLHTHVYVLLISTVNERYVQAKQRCSVLEDQIVDLIIVAMERSEKAADGDEATGDDNDDDDGYDTGCFQLWQHLSSQLIFFVLFQFSSFPHMVNALYEKVSVCFSFSVILQCYDTVGWATGRTSSL